MTPSTATVRPARTGYTSFVSIAGALLALLLTVTAVLVGAAQGAAEEGEVPDGLLTLSGNAVMLCLFIISAKGYVSPGLATGLAVSAIIMVILGGLLWLVPTWLGVAETFVAPVWPILGAAALYLRGLIKT